MQISEHKINWLNVILAQMDSSSTTVEILAKAGSINENKQNNWISHFLEHMFFKWGKKYKTPLEVSQAIDEIWGSFNAFTGYEYAGYYVKTAPNFVNKSIDVLSDMLVNGQFPENEIEKEKWVVIQELKMIEDNPARLAYYKFNEFYYWDNSYGWPIIWTEKNILGFTRQDLINYKNSLYTKDNLVIVVAGKITNPHDVLQQIWEKFWNLPEKRAIPEPKFSGITLEKEGFFKKDTQQNHLLVWIPWINVKSDKKYVFDVLATILWWNMSSVLVQEIREKLGLAYYISASHYAKSQDGVFLIRAGLDKKNFEKWKKKIAEILDKFTLWNISKDKFEKAKSYLIWSLQIGLETSDEVADFVVFNKLFKGKIFSIDELIENVEKVTYDDVVSLAKEFLGKDKRKWFWVE